MVENTSDATNEYCHHECLCLPILNHHHQRGHCFIELSIITPKRVNSEINFMI